MDDWMLRSLGRGGLVGLGTVECKLSGGGGESGMGAGGKWASTMGGVGGDGNNGELPLGGCRLWWIWMVG